MSASQEKTIQDLATQKSTDSLAVKIKQEPGSVATTLTSASASASASTSSSFPFTSASAPGSTARTADSLSASPSYPASFPSSTAHAVAQANPNGNQGKIKSVQTIRSIDELRKMTNDEFTVLSEKGKRGNLAAITETGLCFYEGANNITIDYRASFKMFKFASDKTFAPAQFYVGESYLLGRGVLSNQKAAFAYTKLSAAQNYGPALTALATYYKNGIGTLTRLDPKWENSRKCRRINELQKLNSTQFEDLKRDANSGNPIAQYELSACFFHGLSVAAKDYQSAFVYAELSAEQGYISGLNNLAYCYLRAIGVRQNLPLAVTLFTLAAEQHNPLAQRRLGLLYRDGHGVQPNGKTALHYMKLSAAQNCAPALSALANFYAKGIGCAKQLPKDLKLRQELTSEELKRLSPEQFLGIIDEATSGNPVAQSELVTGYKFGIQVIINDQRDYKIKYYSELAAEQGYAPGQYKLGRCYESGTGVVINIELAKVLYGLAAEQGDRLAQDALIRLAAINPKSIASSSAASATAAIGVSVANQAKPDNVAAQSYSQIAASASNALVIPGQLKTTEAFVQEQLAIFKQQFMTQHAALAKEVQELKKIITLNAQATTASASASASASSSGQEVISNHNGYKEGPLPNPFQRFGSTSASASPSASGSGSTQTATINHSNGAQGQPFVKDSRRFASTETGESAQQQKDPEHGNKKQKH